MSKLIKCNKIKERIYEVIFEVDIFMGCIFDIFLLVVILISVLIVMLELVDYI